MEKYSFEILKKLYKYGELNLYQFQVLIPFLSVEKFWDRLVSLQNSKYIERVYTFPISKDEYDEKINTLDFEVNFKLTLLGKEYVESYKSYFLNL